MESKRIDFLFFFLLFASFSYLLRSDRRFSSEQKAKLDYATRVTHKYQYLSILSKFKSRKFSYLCYFEPKDYVMA